MKGHSRWGGGGEEEEVGVCINNRAANDILHSLQISEYKFGNTLELLAHTYGGLIS